MKKDSERLFKDDITKDAFDNEIYNQITRNIAKACDIDLAKTPLVDLITTYVDYNNLKFKNKIITEENKQLRDVLNKAKYKIERKIAFCSCEAKGHINSEKCNKTILFLKKLLDDLKEAE